MSLLNPLKVANEGCKCEELTETEKYTRLDEILKLYEDQEGNMINALYIAQSIFGYLPKEVIKHVAKKLDSSVIKVAGVASFYSFFNRFPKGKYSVKVCLGTACFVRGGKALLEKLQKDLGINIGETTRDGMYSLEIVRCVGACALAPVVMVNNDTHRRVKSNKLNQILKSYSDKVAVS